ncbi:Uncharacterised protein [Vibrio cholerae]|nr:Uncharacterised protein [Vibrio cholerae]
MPQSALFNPRATNQSGGVITHSKTLLLASPASISVALIKVISHRVKPTAKPT